MERIGFIAGSGRFPEIFAKVACVRGFQVVALGYCGDIDLAFASSVDVLYWVYFG